MARKRVRPARKPQPTQPDQGKRKQASLTDKKAAREFRKMEREGRVANGVIMPVGAVAADLSKQTPQAGYSARLFYTDQEFHCSDCGVAEVWTARQQKWYYEVAKGSIYGEAKHCRACRKKRREAKARQRQHMSEMALVREKKSKR
jgi:hypothetical protein